MKFDYFFHEKELIFNKNTLGKNTINLQSQEY